MRDTPRGIVEELRETARLLALELRVDASELNESDAADYIEHLEKALRRIEAGEADPEQIAHEALEPMRWMVKA